MIDKVQEKIDVVTAEICHDWDSVFIRNLRDLLLARVEVCRKAMETQSC